MSTDSVNSKNESECVSVDLESKIPGCESVRWRDFLLLRDWDLFVFPPVGFYGNLILVAQKFEQIQRFLAVKLIVTSGFRPLIYNEWVGGARSSAHQEGLAVDFISATLTSSTMRERLRPVLEQFKIRVENAPTRHCHMDLRDPGPSGRFFAP